MSLGISAAAWAGIGAVGSIGLGVYGANQAGRASDAQQQGNANALALERENRNVNLTMLEPNRNLGYQALGDLGHLYGYSQSPYTPLNALTNPTGSGLGGPIQVNGKRGGSGGVLNSLSLGAIGSSGGGKFGGTIDPLTGTVSLVGDTGKNADKRDALLEEYLRTGVVPSGNHPKIARFIKAIGQLRAQGYQYDPNAATAQSATPEPSGQAGNMDRFFTSPDYTFRRDEGQRDIGNSFAARGGAASGNALRALAQFNSGLASGEFNNYTNRLMQMAGMGTAATNNAINVNSGYTNSAGNLMQQQGDARASGIMGQYGSLVGGLTGAGNFMGNYLGGRNSGSYGNSPYSSASYNLGTPSQGSWDYLNYVNGLSRSG